MKPTLADLMKQGPDLGDGGYLIELQRRGYVEGASSSAAALVARRVA